MENRSIYLDRDLLERCGRLQKRTGINSFCELGRCSLELMTFYQFFRLFDLSENDVLLLVGQKRSGLETIQNMYNDGTLDKPAAEKAIRALLRNKAEWIVDETEKRENMG